MVKKDEICRFCSIDTFKTRTIKTYKYTFVVFSNPRLMPGHILVIPKRHVEKLTDLKIAERKELFDVVSIYCDKVLKFSSGYNIHHNYMPMLDESKTKVNHMHIHIWPREFNDELYLKMLIHEQELFKNVDIKEYAKLSKFLS